MASESIDKTIFIGGISRDVQEADIRDAFKSFGKIENIKMKGDFCFVEYCDPDDVGRAVDGMNSKYICNRKITVQKSYGGRKERTKGPGGGDVCYN
jgi:splicing factor, arginine/serine-rich 7